ncbi:MAG TPA: AAA family ATPase [Anaerolineaceae bacterium]|nr:AAA family ATPase [Anaerolineaceae bacterium]
MRPSTLEVQLLGGFSVRYDGREVQALRSERLALLLSYLALHADAALTRRQVAYLFWPETGDEQARTNLRNLFHYFKKALPEADALLELDGQTIRWRDASSLSVDALQFRTALTAARAAQDDETRIRHLQEAVNRYRGELLPGRYQDWVLLMREELQQEFLDALSQLTKALEEARRYEEAVEAANRLIRADALNEGAYLQSMRLRALMDDRAGALQVYYACATTLRRELGVEPSQEIQSFYQRLVGAEQSARSEVREEKAPEQMRLIGRKQEWSRLKEAWGSAQKGKAAMVLILGEAGIGKTRLASELMQWARRQGIHAARAECFAAEGNLPFAPIVAWLRTPEIREERAGLEALWKHELARLLPEDAAGGTPSSGRKWERRRLFEAVARGLLGSGAPRLLMLDDAQWSDSETLEIVHYLMRYDANAALMILMTARVEELDEEHPLTQLRLSLQERKQLHELELMPLDKPELGLLARDVLGRDLEKAEEDELFRQTEGNPLFIVETLRSGKITEVGIPQTLRSVLTRRLGGLSGAARELVGVAGVIGREFRYPLLARASQMNESELVQALDELWLRRVIQIQRADAYNFTHGKLQEVAYEVLSAPRRQLLHRKIAEALETEREDPSVIARHWDAGGQSAQAVEAYRRAAEAARRVFANSDALAHLERALELLKEKVGVETEEQKKSAGEICEALGDIYEMGNNQKSLKRYREALTLVESSDGLSLARVLGKLARAEANHGNLQEGLNLFAQAEEALGEPSETEDWQRAWLKVQFDRVWVEYDANRVEALEAALTPIRPVVEHLGELEKLGEYYFLFPTAYFRRDGYQINDEIMRYSKLALETSAKTDNLELQTRTNFGYGFCHFLRGDFDEAILYLGEGLRLAEQIGYVELQLMSVTYLAAAYRSAGRVEDCQTCAERALTLSEREGFLAYVAASRANLGWVAWRRNDLRQAKALSLSALEMWGAGYPFRWLALWTLIDLCLHSLGIDEALEYARKLKEPHQQIFDKEGDDLLMQALSADTGNATSLLAQALAWAKKRGYL